MTISYNQLVSVRKNINEKKLKKPSKWLFPHGLERKYKRLIHWFVRQIQTQINEQLKPRVPEMIEQVESTYPNQDAHDMYNFSKKINMKKQSCTRNDDFLDTLRAIMESIELSLKPYLEETIREMESIGTEISQFNQKQFEKVTKSVFGIDIFIDQPYLRDQLELFARQNSQLITSIPEQELLQVSGIIERSLVEGRRFTDVSKELQKRFGITRRRANLIGRDQTTKLNASLTRLRQESIGVTEYIWQTAGDERVRPTHKAHDGKVFKWSDPPRDTGHPGTDINCRCVAIPIMEGVID